MRRRVWSVATARLALLLALGLLAASSVAGPSRAPSSPRTPWVLTFDDEFNGTTLDASKWAASTGPQDAHDQPIQYFLPEDVTVQDGYLRIRSEQRRYAGYDYTSGELRSQGLFAQKYGRYEVRCRFPQTPGTWSAAYLLPASGRWPPEIDITEHVGVDDDTVYLTNHWGHNLGDHEFDSQRWYGPPGGTAAWHVYTAEWEPGTVRWFIDGRPAASFRGEVAAEPMYLRLNTAIGGYFAREPAPGPWPQDFDVDYVRVWRRADQSPPVVGAAAWARAYPPAPPRSAGASDTEPEDDEDGGTVLPWAAVFVVALLWARLRRAGTARRRGTTQVLALAVGTGAAYYLGWRVGVVNWDAAWIGVPLLAAECFGLAQVLGLHYTCWPRRAPEVFLFGDPSRAPVFILIPTVDEGAPVLEPTVRGALAARDAYLREHPGAAVTVVICNDGFVRGWPRWEEAEYLGMRLGVRCVTRRASGGAKAGNVEHARQAVGATGDALIALFDADQIPAPEFLLQTVPPFADPGVGWVQTGQYYRNLDNPVARWAHDQQSLFYRVLCPGKAALNAAFICGTNVVIRAAALDEIGGLPQDSITEDFAASVLLHGRWRSLFLPGQLASGLGPMDLPSYFAQQRRWATGTLGVLRRQWRLIFTRRGGLTGPQRVQYALAATNYLCGLRDLIFLAAPLTFLVGGVAAIRGATWGQFLWHFGPFFVASQLAFWYLAWGKTSVRGLVLGLGSFPVLVGSLLTVLAGRRVGFAVTAKRRTRRSVWGSLRPHLVTCALCVLGLVAAHASGGAMPTRVSMVWVAYMLAMLAGLLWLGMLDWRADRRRAPAPSVQAVAGGRGDSEEGQAHRAAPTGAADGR